MTKNLRFVLMGMLMLLTGSAFAEDVTINFDDDYATLFPSLPGVSCNANADAGIEASNDGDFTVTTTSTPVNGVTVTVPVADEGKTANRIWNSSPRLRMYSGTFTISGTDITKIVFDAGSNFNITTTQGTLEGKIWTGDKCAEVSFTVAKNTQLRKIVVTLGDGGSVVEEIEQLTVAQALSKIDELADNGKTDKEYKVLGYVVGIDEISTSYGNATFDIADEREGNPILKYYRGKGFNGADITNSNLVVVGDQVIVQGILQKYVKEGVVTPEVAQGGKIVSINGKTSDDTVTDITKVSNIAQFKDLAEGTAAELTLSNAVVTYKNINGSTIELFITDSSGAMDLYNLGIDNAEAGSVLNGTIIGSRGANSGFTIAMKKIANTDPSSVTITTTQEVQPVVITSLDEATYDAYGCYLVKITNVKVSADGKKAMAGGDELALYDRFKTGLLSGLEEDKEYDITGLIYDGGATYGTELVVTALTLAGGGVIIDDPATPVAGIPTLLTLDSPSTNLELMLSDAKVLFNDNNYIYVRENGKAVCFYKIDGLKDVAKTNAFFNGKIKVDYEIYHLLPEVKSNKNTTLEDLTFNESEEAAEPIPTTVTEIAEGNNVCDLVTLQAKMVKEVTYKEDGSVNTTTYYLEDEVKRIVVVNNGKGLNKVEEGTMVTCTGIVNTNNDAYQIKLTKTVPESTDIHDLTAEANADNHIYNLAGQRLEKVQRGVNIIGGKKLMVK